MDEEEKRLAKVKSKRGVLRSAEQPAPAPAAAAEPAAASAEPAQASA